MRRWIIAALLVCLGCQDDTFDPASSPVSPEGGRDLSVPEGTIGASQFIPTPIPGGPYSGFEGSPVSFDGSQSFDPDGDAVTSIWNFGDGGAATGPIATHTYGVGGVYNAFIVVTDEYGNPAYGSTSVTIANVNPVLDTTADISIPVNGTLALGYSFTDPGGGPWTLSREWGDGTSTTVITYRQGGMLPGPGHFFPVAGTFSVRSILSDATLLSDTTFFTVTVTPNGVPNAVINGPYTGIEGANIQFSSAGTSDPDNDPLDYVWWWGDGTPASFLPNPTHRYANNGSYVVTLTVVDPNNFRSTATTTVTIDNVAPTATFNKPAAVNEGGSFTLSTTSPNDVPADKNAGFTYAFDCGTGFGGFASASTRSCAAMTDNGTTSVGSRIQDRDGGVREYLGNVPVKNVVPKVNVTAGGATTIPRGASFALTGSFTDPGALDAPWTYAITWGDGTAPSTGAGTPGSQINSTHVFNTIGTWTVRMLVTDKNGGKGTSNAITVRVQ